jgi:hypothetical protein
MEVTKDSLLKLYQQTETDELLKLHSQGTLTELAYNVLEMELTRRGITPPPRQILVDSDWQSDSSHDYRLGKKPLFKTWVMLGVIGNFMMMFLLLAFGKMIHGLFGEPWNILVLFAPMPYLEFAWVSIWRCASNTYSKFWLVMARGYVVVWALKWILIWVWLIIHLPTRLYRAW